MPEEDPQNTEHKRKPEWEANVVEAFSGSLWICQMKDKERAAFEGAPLTLDTLVEDGFTHAESVMLHPSLLEKKEKCWTRSGLINSGRQCLICKSAHRTVTKQTFAKFWISPQD